MRRKHKQHQDMGIGQADQQIYRSKETKTTKQRQVWRKTLKQSDKGRYRSDVMGRNALFHAFPQRDVFPAKYQVTLYQDKLHKNRIDTQTHRQVNRQKRRQVDRQARMKADR